MEYPLFNAAVNALIRLLAEGSEGPDRNDMGVHRIPPCGVPVLYLLTLRGTAKECLEGVLALVTGREERRSVGVWALDRRDVESLMRTVRVISHS